jgi:hypothetical protein
MAKKNKVIEAVKKAYKVYCGINLVLTTIKTRGFGKLNDKELLENAAELITGMESSINPLASKDEINVYFNPYYHILLCKMGCIAAYNPATKIIVVDNTFMNFSDTTKEFIIYHELGHKATEGIDAFTQLINGFCYTITRPLYIIAGKVHPDELMADEYALRESGLYREEIIRSLKEIMNSGFDILGTLEIMNRIKAIEKIDLDSSRKEDNDDDFYF